MSIYKSPASELFIQELYTKQLQGLPISFESQYVQTRFGQTHVLVGGKPECIPLLIFHGGNSTNPHSLIYHVALAKHFRLYAPDTMGHPGLSDQTVLSSNNLEYGQWASDVIDSLGFTEMVCMGGSFGGGVLVKLMEYAPAKVAKSILIVPSGIANISLGSVLFKLGIPMVKYLLMPTRERLVKAILPMALNEASIDDNNISMVEATFKHVSVKAQLPSNAKLGALAKCTAPTLLFAGEKDVLFPGDNVIRRARELIPQLTYSECLKGCPHMYMLDSNRLQDMNDKIVRFIME
jgi:pimeloyl-ACP methyl ester carboxylesterase